MELALELAYQIMECCKVKCFECAAKPQIIRMEIGKNIASLLENLPATVELVAVSKTKSNGRF